jgi:hypothetical protein
MLLHRLGVKKSVKDVRQLFLGFFAGGIIAMTRA